MLKPQLTSEIIQVAIDGYELQKTRIDAKIAELRAMLDGRQKPATAMPEAQEAPRRKRRLSAAGRRAISEAAKKRWAAIKGAKPEETPAKAPRQKRKMSAAGRRAISAAQKKRWAVLKAAKESPARRKAGRKVAVKKAAVKAAPAKAAKRAPAGKPAKAPAGTVAAITSIE